jgi:hypothetical protein
VGVKTKKVNRGKSLADYWEAYKTEVIPDAASTIQIQETRRAYYFGAQVMFGLLGDMSQECITQEEAVQRMSSLNKELQDFVISVLQSAS